MSFEKLAFYRGVSDNFPLDHPMIVMTRKNRKPRDTNIELHNAADEWFFEKFGVKYRSQAVFVTPQLDVARGYGATFDHVVRVIPLGGYSFCWSKKFADMLLLLNDGVKLAEVSAYLDRAEYTELDLSSAYTSGNELMLYCNAYVAIPVLLLPEL
ncbi:MULTISPECIES: hypothetical protein [unclassified Pseudomonas]|nr:MULTISPECIES: hypothetical protein [unclassified Pseudomonas]